MAGAAFGRRFLARAVHAGSKRGRDFASVYYCPPFSSRLNSEDIRPVVFPPLSHSQAKLNAVARQLNERPRKTLDFETPAQRFSQCVATIG
jgi:IS30 family transposase